MLCACSPTEVEQPEPRPVVISEYKPAEKMEVVYSVPEKAKPYIKYYLHHENPSRNMAQTEQECSWNHYAVSRVGAIGCAQAMPDTLEWGAKTFARHLGDPQPNNPRYAAEFLESYMQFFTVHPLPTDCGNRKIDEQRYNGGFYVIWEVRESDGTLAGARKICGQRMKNGKRRSESSCEENYSYPEHISRRQQNYKSVGGLVCH